jgi:polyferredoxin
MTGELDVFRAELRAAGQPWSRRGIWSAGAGIILLAALQGILLGTVQLPPAIEAAIPPLAILSLALIAVGWAFLIVAFVKRRQWSKAHPLILPGLSEGATKSR